MMEDLNQHSKKCIQRCDTFNYNGVTDEVIRLQLFPYSLIYNTFSWLNSQSPISITTWEKLARKFLQKLFLINKTVQLRRETTTFKQLEGEGFHKAWELFKTLIQICPHHGLPKWLKLQMFYNGLDAHTRSRLDGAVLGALMNMNMMMHMN